MIRYTVGLRTAQRPLHHQKNYTRLVSAVGKEITFCELPVKRNLRFQKSNSNSYCSSPFPGGSSGVIPSTNLQDPSQPQWIISIISSYYVHDCKRYHSLNKSLYNPLVPRSIFSSPPYLIYVRSDTQWL